MDLAVCVKGSATWQCHLLVHILSVTCLSSLKVMQLLVKVIYPSLWHLLTASQNLYCLEPQPYLLFMLLL